MSLFDLSGVIIDLSTGPIEVELPAATTYVDGDPVEADPALLQIAHAVVTDAEWKELQSLPEGDRSGNIKCIQTVQKIPTLSVGDQESAAVVRHGGRRFRVMNHDDLGDAANVHIVLAKKIEEG